MKSLKYQGIEVKLIEINNFIYLFVYLFIYFADLMTHFQNPFIIYNP